MEVTVSVRALELPKIREARLRRLRDARTASEYAGRQCRAASAEYLSAMQSLLELAAVDPSVFGECVPRAELDAAFPPTPPAPETKGAP